MKESVDQLHLLTLNVGLAVHHGDWNWRDVSSPFARIYYVVEGEAQLIMPDGIHVLIPRYMYFIPPYTIHSYRCDAHFVHYYLHVYEDAPAYSGFLEEWIYPVEVEAGELEQMLFERLCQLNPHMVLPQSDPQSYDNSLVLEQNITKNRQRSLCNKVESRGIILFEAVKGKSRIDERIRQSVLEIRRNIFHPICLIQLAKTVNLSKDHFIRLFKKEMGCTPQQYINQKKVEQAQLMLLTDDMPVKALAYQLGYDDPSYFCRLFKQRVGCTPVQYRQKVK